jgi:hypothetical protein
MWRRWFGRNKKHNERKNILIYLYFSKNEDARYIDAQSPTTSTTGGNKMKYFVSLRLFVIYSMEKIRF